MCSSTTTGSGSIRQIPAAGHRRPGEGCSSARQRKRKLIREAICGKRGLAFLSPPVLTERRENAVVQPPTAMGIDHASAVPSASHYSIFPTTCQDQTAGAVAAVVLLVAGHRPPAPGISAVTIFGCFSTALFLTSSPCLQLHFKKRHITASFRAP